jgi:Circadian oscillating protein COP23
MKLHIKFSGQHQAFRYRLINRILKPGAKVFGMAVFTTFAIGLSFNQPSLAKDTTFFCGISPQRIPTTYARTERGNIPVIRWVSKNFVGSGYTPQRRCEEVSRRFQSYKNSGILNYITTGIMNRQPVVCVSTIKGGGCQGLLFTLKPEANASRVLQQLFNIGDGSATSPLYESSRQPSNSDTETTSIDINQFLSTTPVESLLETTPIPEPEVTSPDRIW